MALDGGIHHVGTKTVHIAPALILVLAGFAFGNDLIMSFAGGMLVVLLFGNIRCGASYYRWRVRDRNDAK